MADAREALRLIQNADVEPCTCEDDDTNCKYCSAFLDGIPVLRAVIDERDRLRAQGRDLSHELIRAQTEVRRIQAEVEELREENASLRAEIAWLELDDA